MSHHGRVAAICIGPKAGEPMMEIEQVLARAGMGLEGDRYCRGEGSFNKGAQGKRQVTLINGQFFPESGFRYVDSRRNIVTHDVELMDLIGKEFEIGDARMRGVKYCDPCTRPSKLSKIERSFKQAFSDRGGLVAEVIRDGVIHVGSSIVPPEKDY